MVDEEWEGYNEFSAIQPPGAQQNAAGGEGETQKPSGSKTSFWGLLGGSGKTSSGNQLPSKAETVISNTSSLRPAYDETKIHIVVDGVKVEAWQHKDGTVYIPTDVQAQINDLPQSVQDKISAAKNQLNADQINAVDHIGSGGKTASSSLRVDNEGNFYDPTAFPDEGGRFRPSRSSSLTMSRGFGNDRQSSTHLCRRPGVLALNRAMSRGLLPKRTNG